MITAIAVICFFTSCEDHLKEIQKMEIASIEPIGKVENMLLKHTDSGRLKLTIQGKKMLDYSNDQFPYTQFPDGIKVNIYEYQNDSTQVTVITANTATMYDQTNLIDLRGNVKIVNHDGSVFTGSQLYWDQTAKWVFTNQDFETFIVNEKNKKDVAHTTATILDANQDLTKIVARDPNDTFITRDNDE
jgi:LPS export ABC transporter protein LptC